MRYQISYTEEARRAIPDLPGNYRQRIKRVDPFAYDRSSLSRQRRVHVDKNQIAGHEQFTFFKINDQIIGSMRRTHVADTNGFIVDPDDHFLSAFDCLIRIPYLFAELLPCFLCIGA